MAFDLWARAQSKWRGILVYTALQAAMRFVSAFIYGRALHVPGLQLYASVVQLATSVFCFTQILRLLTTDEDGDEAWPSLW